MRTTHTYATLGVTKDTYKEIRDKLEAADYGHCFIDHDSREEVIDMHGIGLMREVATLDEPGPVFPGLTKSTREEIEALYMASIIEIHRLRNLMRLGNSRTYEAMPKERPHYCHANNSGGVPVDWIIYEERQGFSLNSTDAYGDGSIVHINYCPWCGEKLMLPEHEAVLTNNGKRNRAGTNILQEPKRGPSTSKTPLYHMFDSSLTCDYCGIAAEKVQAVLDTYQVLGGMAETTICPERVRMSKVLPKE